jgi:hypothetical protein
MGVEFNPSNLSKKSVLKDLNGNIINLLDETDGGWIIRNRRVVNQSKFDELVKKENDKRIASKAVAEQVSASPEVLASRLGQSVKTEKTEKTDLEKRVDNMESKLDSLLKIMNDTFVKTPKK